jgi:hypothetical protein
MTTDTGHWNWLNLSEESAKWENKIFPYSILTAATHEQFFTE